MSYSTVGLPVQAALEATGRFERVELRRGPRWSDWSLLVTMAGVEAELAFVGMRPASDVQPVSAGSLAGRSHHLRLLSPGRGKS